ncbi:DUF7555 family protein [Natronorubrum sulfidifaciens]|uniref:Uncharacterized protein n=1 Tax=Natronorubrum sulfidifaciens JCM 14089 TaxID=1230460 RepID=L9W4L0_9EURY|nr:hypothetical protein [Natronorubrum sulfidifaciens]ELY44390.1 hypothetical protein C495_10824 [Natronorubrum sulfidifaciens JCM 14089]
MARTDSFENRLRVFARIWIDAVTYALAVTAAAGIGAVVIAIATGGGLVRAKYLLFVGGWLLLAYATVRLWPSSPDNVDPQPTTQYRDSLPETGESTRFQQFVQTLPPVRWMQPPPPDRRLTISGKLLLSSLLILALSFLMETRFGIS